MSACQVLSNTLRSLSDGPHSVSPLSPQDSEAPLVQGPAERLGS